MGAPNPYLLKLTEAETLRFLELYRIEEVLWNTNLEEYRNRSARNAAASRVANTLDVPGFTAQYVFIKFKNLRSSYCQELKKIAESISSGCGEIYRPKVWWFHTMNSFLRPFVQSPAAKLNLYLDSSDISVSDVQKDDMNMAHFMDQSCDQTSTHSATTDEPIQFLTSWGSSTDEAINHEEDSHALRSPPPASEASSSRQRAKRVKLSKTVKSNYDNFIITDLSDTKLSTTVKKDDSFDCFGKYAASLLRNMPIKKALRIQLELTSKLLREQIDACDEQAAVDDDPVSNSNGEKICTEVEDGLVKEEVDVDGDDYVDLTAEINYDNYSFFFNLVRCVRRQTYLAKFVFVLIFSMQRKA